MLFIFGSAAIASSLFWLSRSPGFNLLWVLVAACFTGLSLWRGLPLKRVAVDGNSMFVSNYRLQIAVPFDQIKHIDESFFRVNQRAVIVSFRSSTAFGDRIIFVPKRSGWLLPWQTHPIVDELQRQVGLTTQSHGAGDEPYPA